MKEKERKYFMAGTDEEVFLGDVISTQLEKCFDDGRSITREVEFKLTEETLPLALETGIIEYEEEDEELLDFNEEEDECENCIMNNMLNELCIDQEKIEDRVKALEETVGKLWDMYKSNSEPSKPQKTDSSKKK